MSDRTTITARVSRAVCLLLPLCSAASCVPALRPLSGAPAPAVLPRAEIPLGHHRILFNWELQDRELSGRGEGIARVAGPDSARLDLFLAAGFGAAAAILINDSLQISGGSMARRFIPPAALLWAALGRNAIPALRDTTARVDGGLLRVDIGSPITWRLTFRGDSLVRLERVSDSHVVEWVERSDSSVHYRSEQARRALVLTIKSIDEVPAFDASIWGPF